VGEVKLRDSAGQDSTVNGFRQQKRRLPLLGRVRAAAAALPSARLAHAGARVLSRAKRLITVGRADPLFDEEYYLARYPDVRQSGWDAYAHYLRHGAREGRDPSPGFDTSFYLASNPDVRESGENPLRHYARRGKREGRLPKPEAGAFGARISAEDVSLVATSGLFDAGFYRRQLRGALDWDEDGLIAHYLSIGWQDRLDPSPRFGTYRYLVSFPEVAESGINPLVHYLRWGRARGLDPHGGAAAAGPLVAVEPTGDEWAALLRCWTPPKVEPLVDVVVPVYRGVAETLRCLYSVLSAANVTPHRLVVVEDRSPEPDLVEALSRLARHGAIELHANPENLGFVSSCNHAIGLHPGRDVVLLNSDTEVFGDWLDRLRTAAYRHPRTATVTPLSSNAEICSYPRFARDNPFALEIDDKRLDALARAVNRGREVELPTGIGFCLYLRRDCLDEIGKFDAETFGRGYGEENDLCRRAARSGWRNILAADVFVRHYGGTSFGEEKRRLVAAAIETVERLHPGYNAEVAEFVRRDPVRPAREALDLARLRAHIGNRPAILMVCHGWGGGTERHLRDLAALLRRSGVATLVCRPSRKEPGTARIESLEGLETPNLPSFAVGAATASFASQLRSLRVAHLHIHSLAGFPEGSGDFFRRTAREAGIRYDVTLHDYMPVCPRLTLVDGSGRYCGEPPAATCQACLVRNGSPFGAPDIAAWRGGFERLLRGARRIFAPDADVADRFNRRWPDLAIAVQPHPEQPSQPVAARRLRGGSEGEPRRVAVLGGINVSKGAEVLLRTATAAQEDGLPLRFVVIGHTDRDAAFRRLGNVTITGRYACEEDALAALAEHDPDLVWFPAVWPETYSYTLSLAFAAGRLPVAFDIGAVANRIRAAGFGSLLPLELCRDGIVLARTLATLGAEPGAPPSIGRDYEPIEGYYGFAPDWTSALGDRCSHGRCDDRSPAA
jgi:GT2 family glycosyltransferase/glycosyltransferase involved in cell wall biosynthesis